jgi:hypothetical protein
MTTSTENGATGKAPGWFRLPNAALEIISQHGWPAFGVLAYLTMRANGSGESFPSLETIANDLGTSRPTIKRAIAKLRKAGYLTVRRRRRDVNIFQVRGITSEPSRNQEGSPVTPSGITSDPLRGSPVTHRTRPNNKTHRTRPKRESGQAAPPPPELLVLIDGWNALEPSIVKPGNGARRDPISKAVLQGWQRVNRDPEAREAFRDLPALLAAIRKARFCHGQDWFDLEWMFSKNKARKWNAVKVLNGQHDDAHKTNGRQQPVCSTGFYHDPARSKDSKHGKWK